LGHRFGRLVDVDRVEHDRPHAGGDRLLDQGVGPLQPVVVTEVGVADTQFQPGLGERVVDRVGHRVDRRVLTVLEWADVENAHEYSFTARACRTGRTTGNACCAPRSPAPLRAEAAAGGTGDRRLPRSLPVSGAFSDSSSMAGGAWRSPAAVGG